MKRLQQAFVLSALMVCVATVAWSQTVTQEKKPTLASVAGRVTFGDKPLPKAIITLQPTGGGGSGNTPARAYADAQGNYVLTSVPEGSYRLMASYPGYVSAGDMNGFNSGIPIIIEEGETIGNMDFELKRGGVITGRITDAGGRPVIGMNVLLSRIDEQGRETGGYFPNLYPQMLQTDDRGEYRIYGVPAGRYKVGVGAGRTTSLPMRNGFFVPTYYPGVTETAKAEVLEVTEGSEIDNVNISFSSPETTYIAVGRVLDAVSGKPVAGVYSAFGLITNLDAMQRIFTERFGNTATSTTGEFKLEGLTPGRYAAFLSTQTPFGNQENYYSKPVVFEVKDTDVSGIEIKAFRGASLSGTVVFEGNDPAKLMQQLAPFSVSANKVTDDRKEISVHSPSTSPVRVLPDGSFILPNVEPGNLYLNVHSSKAPQQIQTVRLEVNGEDRRRGFEVKSGEQVTGVRVVLAQRAGVIRGSVKIENGTLPENTRLTASLHRNGNPPPSVNGAEIDSLGRFQFQGLETGDYEVVVQVTPVMSNPPSPTPPAMPRIKPVKQAVRVTNGAEARVTLILDLSPSTDR
jgi:hypothetical protein